MTIAAVMRSVFLAISHAFMCFISGCNAERPDRWLFAGSIQDPCQPKVMRPLSSRWGLGSLRRDLFPAGTPDPRSIPRPSTPDRDRATTPWQPHGAHEQGGRQHQDGTDHAKDHPWPLPMTKSADHIGQQGDDGEQRQQVTDEHALVLAQKASPMAAPRQWRGLESTPRSPSL